MTNKINNTIALIRKNNQLEITDNHLDIGSMH